MAKNKREPTISEYPTPKQVQDYLQIGQNHLNNESNPHNVTAAQVGAAPSSEGVTNGNTHDHSGGDGAQINHTTLSNIGTNTHAQVDTAVSNSVSHIADTTKHAANLPEAALTTQLTALTHTAPVDDFAIQDLVNIAPYGFVTKDEGNTVLKVIANLQTRLSELESRLQDANILS